MKIKILMVYPKIPSTYWSFKHALPFIGYSAFMPPFGLITVAAMLPKDYEVKLVDVNVRELNDYEIMKADYVFISAMIVQKNSFEKIIRRCKELSKPVVAGGPYPTSSYESIDDVDHFVLNVAEITLPLFIRDLEMGVPKRVYKDLTKPDIEKSPVPRFDLLDMGVYSTMNLQSSRGCPFNCEFCDIIEMFGRTPRTKNPEQFISELNAVYDLGFRGPLFIVDDNFIGNRKKITALLEKVKTWQKERNYPFTFVTQASVNLASDDDLIALMRDSGFNMIFIGIETPDRDTLKLTDKNQNIKTDLLESEKKIQHFGIEVLAGFILGLAHEPEDIFERQIEFIQRAGIPIAMIGLMLALPNTRLYKRLVREGRLISNSTGNNTHCFDLNFTPTTPKERLLSGYRSVISSVCSPSLYFERCLTMLREFPKHRIKLRSKINFRDTLAFFRSLRKQTLSSYGAAYISYLVKALFINYREFPLAVTLAIKGYHLFTITDEIMAIDKSV